MISIIVPVFNEQDRLESSLREICSFLKKSRLKFEVVVVNDGSTDSTLDILSKLEKELAIRVINQKKNLGKGAAIKTGVNESKGDLIIFTDIDLSVPIETVNIYLDRLNDDVDIIIGTRALNDSKVEVRQFWLRELLGEGFTFISNLILQVGVSDFTCGFKLFRREAALKVFNKQRVSRWTFDAESLFIAKKYGFKIKEVPVIWRHRSGSKVKFPQDIIESLLNLFMIRVNGFFGKYD